MTMEFDKGRYASPEGSATWEYIASISCSFLFISVGSILGWNSPAVAELMGSETNIKVTASEAANLVTSFAGGLMLAPVLSMALADYFGRKMCLLIAGIPMMINWGMIALGKHVVILMVARFLAGISVGLIFCYAPMYMGEIASVKIRGSLGIAISATINIGILSSFVALPYLTIAPTALISLAMVIISEVMILFIPESPYYLVMTGKHDEAEGALEKLRGKTDVTEELDLIKRTISVNSGVARNSEGVETKSTPSKLVIFKKLFTVRGNLKAACINLLFQFVLQMGGYSVIMIYGSLIFGVMNTGVPTNLCTVLVATLQLTLSILTTFTINKIGRRTLILISGGVGATCYLATGVYLYLMEYTKVDLTPYRIFPLCTIMLYVIVMNVGITPLVLVIQSEIYASEIKPLANCLVGICTGLISAVTSKLFLSLAITWGLGYSVPFIGSSVITLIGTTLILWLLPETRGKTLLEIQRDLNA